MNATLFHTKAAFYRTASASEAGKPGFRNGMVRIRKKIRLIFPTFFFVMSDGISTFARTTRIKKG